MELPGNPWNTTAPNPWARSRCTGDRINIIPRIRPDGLLRSGRSGTDQTASLNRHLDSAIDPRS
jgi:hypothetical protein